MTANLPTFICSDLGAVPTTNICVAVEQMAGIDRLHLTAGDIADYDALMQIRLGTLREHGLTIHDVHAVIATVEPLPGAVEFVQWIRARTRFAIVTDSFYEFLEPILPKLGYPTVFAHALEVDAAGFITGYRLRVPNSKQKAVQALELIGFRVMAFGDSYNDTPMLAEAELGVLYDPPPNVVADFPHFAVARTYADLRGMAEEFFARPPAPVTA